MSESKGAEGAETLTNWVAGAPAAPLDGTYVDVHNPATGRVIANLPRSKAADVDAGARGGRLGRAAGWQERAAPGAGPSLGRAEAPEAACCTSFDPTPCLHLT